MTYLLNLEAKFLFPDFGFGWLLRDENEICTSPENIRW
jgi:hypothetical protein